MAVQLSQSQNEIVQAAATIGILGVAGIATFAIAKYFLSPAPGGPGGNGCSASTCSCNNPNCLCANCNQCSSQTCPPFPGCPCPSGCVTCQCGNICPPPLSTCPCPPGCAQCQSCIPGNCPSSCQQPCPCGQRWEGDVAACGCVPQTIAAVKSPNLPQQQLSWQVVKGCVSQFYGARALLDINGNPVATCSSCSTDCSSFASSNATCALFPTQIILPILTGGQVVDALGNPVCGVEIEIDFDSYTFPLPGNLGLNVTLQLATNKITTGDNGTFGVLMAATISQPVPGSEGSCCFFGNCYPDENIQFNLTATYTVLDPATGAKTNIAGQAIIPFNNLVCFHCDLIG